ncbi:MAG: lipoate--protein ligase [Planctomycetia bacterium]|nr:lipoate--protein ligase [Planctomycetia bacterium]
MWTTAIGIRQRRRCPVMLCRLLIDPPAAGSWNMAVDEALLEAAEAQNASGTLRFYQWSEPTLSLGYFQRHDDRRLHPASLDCSLVRRASGGGAIVHDREWTYSLVLPKTHPLSRRPNLLYDRVHQALVDVLRALGVEAKICDVPRTTGRADAFLCFARRVSGDVLLAGNKILGSAQRRRRAAVLQHGSLLLSSSQAAPELPGLFDLAAGLPDPAALIRPWSDELAQRLGFMLMPSELTAAERSAAEQNFAGKFAHDGWNCRR